MTESTWKYFSREELNCRCGRDECKDSWHKMQDDLMSKIVALREQLGFPFVISSAYRCKEHNLKVSDTGSFGPHTTGKAIDIVVQGSKAYQLIKAATQLGFAGIGVNQKGASRFIHLDILTEKEGFPRPWIWSY